MPFIHSPADGPDHVEVAALLVAMAEEAGIHTREIIVTPHGFEIPDSLYEQLNPANSVVLSDPRDEGKTPPPGWDEPLADEVNIEQLDDGKYYLIEDEVEDPEVEDVPGPPKPEAHAVREWAKEHDIKVSAKGKIAQDVIDAYYEANSGE